MHKILLLLLSVSVFMSGQERKITAKPSGLKQSSLQLSEEHARIIFALPIHCIPVEYPNRLGQTLGSANDLKTPKEMRPAFYGCFDWHSSVHGYWSVVTLMQQFPNLDADKNVRQMLMEHLTAENITTEMAFFHDPNNRNFERTYGWAWLFKLQESLNNWQDSDAKQMAKNLQPLTDLLITRYQEYLPKLNYPIRTGTHDNSAFSLSLSLEYARSSGNKVLEELITTHAKRLFLNDTNANLAYEPSGHDFLSPAMEEAYLLSKILDDNTFKEWLTNFLPQIFDPNFQWEVGKVSDRTDGHLIHLDGLNFSRAACLFGLANRLPELKHLRKIAQEHFDHSFPNITTKDDYMGSHWLGTFALHALQYQSK